MAARSWIISVLSTDYDLHDYREAVIAELQSKGAVVSAFELPDFPVEPDIHSHDNCLVALERADIALLIIDKRYGGIYVGDSSHSITEAEYLSMVKNNKPCFAFISAQTWDELHVYNTEFKDWNGKHSYTEEEQKKDVPRSQFNAQYVCTHVDKVQTLEFVDKIQKAYQTHSVSNWMDQYTGTSDLTSKIEGKLKGHSRFVLEGLVHAQTQKLKSRHTSTGFGLSLDDIFSRGYYLEPSFYVESGNLQHGSTLDEMIPNTLLNDSSILVYGEAGYGKTTVLAKSFLSHAKNFFARDSYQIPLYLWLKKKSCDYHFDFSTYVAESFEEDWNRAVYPYLDLSSIRPYFYFDGFDEIAEKMTPDEVEKISKADIFSHPVLLTCRQQYALRYINNFNFSDRFGAKIKINTWDIDMARAYIDNFCRIKEKSSEFVAMVHQLLANNQSLQDILNNPLLITMLLWIIEQNRMRIPETIHTRIELFKACINELAKRELARSKQSEAFAPDLGIVWSYAAWEVYLNNLNGKETKYSVLIPKLTEMLHTIPFSYSTAHFEALFDSSEDKIFGTFHEQFLEFLVANTIFLACYDAAYPYPEFLSYVMRPEINRYFRAIWNECTDDSRNKIVNNLYKQYLNHLGDNSFDSVSKRVHAIYHIGRFNIPTRIAMMDKAFNVETHISVLLSLFFGAIKMGRLDEEQKFYEMLISNSDYNEANRGYHLTYYSDAIAGSQLPFKDDIEKKWEGTLGAFLRHFQNNEKGHFFLRRIDLVTMQQLIEARGNVEPLSEEALTVLDSSIKSSQYKDTYPEFQNKIEIAFSSLYDTYQRLRTIPETK